MKMPDIEAIQAFVLVAELKRFTRAADLVGGTQAAISQKIKRLEEGLGRQLLERTPRKVTLSLHGQAFLGSGILAIGAAVGAGIGIGAMVGRMAPAGCVDVSERFALPPLPSRDVVLYTAQRDAQAQQLIRTLSADIAGG